MCRRTSLLEMGVTTMLPPLIPRRPSRGQRRQEVRQSGLPHPVAQIQGIAAIHQQGVSLLDMSDPISSLMLGSAVSSSTPNDFQPNSQMGWGLIR